MQPKVVPVLCWAAFTGEVFFQMSWCMWICLQGNSSNNYRLSKWCEHWLRAVMTKTKWLPFSQSLVSMVPLYSGGRVDPIWWTYQQMMTLLEVDQEMEVLRIEHSHWCALRLVTVLQVVVQMLCNHRAAMASWQLPEQLQRWNWCGIHWQPTMCGMKQDWNRYIVLQEGKPCVLPGLIAEWNKNGTQGRKSSQR